MSSLHNALGAELISDEQMRRLLDNGAPANRDKPHQPVVKLFTPDANATWLLSEIDPTAPDIAFGLCDLGLGEPELGSVSIAELLGLRGRFGLPIERDEAFRAHYPLIVYARAAWRARRIITDADQLAPYASTEDE